jgi:predicted nucleic-acid-binding Zn-ribbon protein
MSYHRCPKCASTQMVDGAWVAPAQGTRVVVGVDRHPDRGALPRPMSTQVHASVCGACGYVELYANQPRELYEAYRRAESSPSPPKPSSS